MPGISLSVRWFAILAITCLGCTDTSDQVVFTGAAAQEHFSLCNPTKLPSTMTDIWVYDGGSFNGMIYYVSFECETLEDCWQALRAFRAPSEEEFVDGIDTKFAVNEHGPSFYNKELQHPQWNI